MLWYVQKIYPLYLAEYYPYKSETTTATNGTANGNANGTAEKQKKPVPAPTSFSSKSMSSDPRAVTLLSRTLFMRALSFFVFRVWVFPYTVWYAVNNVGGWSNFTQRFGEMPFIVRLMTITNVTLMGSLNFIWTFWITMKWRGFEKRRREAAKTGGSVNYVNEADEFDKREHEITEKLLDKKSAKKD